MGTFSIWHWLIVLAIVLVIFGGGGKLSRLMGDFGKGLRSFKEGLKPKDGEAPADGDGVQKSLAEERATVEATPDKSKAAKS